MIDQDSFLPFARPSVGEDEIDEVVRSLRSGWITSGPGVRDFEKAFSSVVGAAASHAVNSGTAAMHIALDALGVGAGDLVITSPMTFCATAHVIEHVGARPLLVDVERDTLNIDPVLIEDAVRRANSRIAGIMPVHYAGHPCEMSSILEVAGRYSLPIIEDAAHAFGAEYRGVPIGHIKDEEHGRAAAFSFYATKNITTGEGGMLTGNTELVEAARLWSLHGMTRDAWQRYGPSGSWDYDVSVVGHKYNMSDIQAALGRAQLKRSGELMSRRTRIAKAYLDAFGEVDEIECPTEKSYATHAWHLFPIRVRLEMLSINRAEFIDELASRGIGTSVHFRPINLLRYYREKYDFDPETVEVATGEYERLISLPIYPLMADQDVSRVISAVKAVARTNRN